MRDQLSEVLNFQLLDSGESAVFEETPRVLLVRFGNPSVDQEISMWIEDSWKQGVPHSQLKPTEEVPSGSGGAAE